MGLVSDLVAVFRGDSAPPPSSTSEPRSDAWANAYSGMGTRDDRGTATTFISRPTLPRPVLDGLFRQSAIARRIVERKAFDATRTGWTLQEEVGKEELRALGKEWGRLRLKMSIREAITWERYYGGALLVFSIDDGQDQDKPLRWDMIKEIRSVYVAHRWEVIGYRGIVIDEDDPDFGYPETYDIRRESPGLGAALGQNLVHRSRTIPFRGGTLPGILRATQDTWAESVLESVWTELQNAGVADGAAARLVDELSVPVIKLQGLFKLMNQTGPGGQTAFRSRIADIRRQISNSRLLPLDAGDDFVRVSAAVSGIADILSHEMSAVCGASGYPQTLLYGSSAPGLNSTGENDLQIYYDDVDGTLREPRVRPAVEGALKVLIHAQAWGRGREHSNPLRGLERLDIDFDPLWTMDDKTEAEVEESRARTRSTYVNAGIGTSEEALQAVRVESPHLFPELDDDESFDPEVEPEEDEEPPETDPEGGGPPDPSEAEAGIETALDAYDAAEARALLDAFGPARTRVRVDAVRRFLQVSEGEARSFVGTYERTDDRSTSWGPLRILVEVEAGETRDFGPREKYNYPVAYGEIPGTRAPDGDPVDVLLISSEVGPVFLAMVEEDSGTGWEMKLVLGAKSQEEAEVLVRSTYGARLLDLYPWTDSPETAVRFIESGVDPRPLLAWGDRTYRGDRRPSGGE